MTLLFLALALLVQTPAAPPRDVPAQSEQRAGKGILRGRVLDAQSGLPIKGALVTAHWQSREEPPMTSTDAEGRWEIAGLAFGEYHVGASKGGYVDRIDFGDSIGLAETQPERSVDLRLARGAVLSGRVIDGDGEPAVGVQVVVLAEGPTSRGRRGWSMASGGVVTDDRGLFRIFGLPAGEYVLAAQGQDRFPARAISGGRKLTYVTTYYPGTAELAEAQRFTLGEAAEYNDITFALQTLPSISVSGRVVVSADRIRHGFTTLVPIGSRPEHMGPFGSVTVEHDGTFRIPGVTAGMYRLGIRVELSNGEQEVGQLDLTAGDEDISGLVLSTHGPTTLAGRVVVEPVGARRPEMISVNARPLGEQMDMGGQEDVVVNPDGSFELNVFQSPVQLYQSGRMEGWAQSRVRLKGNDVSGGITFEPGQRVEGIEVVLRRAASRLTGSVSGASSESGSENEGVVIAFREGGDDPAGLGVAAMVPIRNGRYALGPLPASEYQLVAVRSSDPKFFQRIELVELLRARATTVSVGDNETKTVSLTLVTEY